MTALKYIIPLLFIVVGTGCAHSTPEPVNAESSAQRELRIRAALRGLKAHPSADTVMPWLDEAEQWMGSTINRGEPDRDQALMWIAVETQLSRARAALSRADAEAALEGQRVGYVARRDRVAQIQKELKEAETK